MDISYIKNIKSFTQTLTLLYVEDDKYSRYETASILELFFKNIIIAKDGLDGLDKYKKTKVDLIITDINMPNMNGIEMVEKVREENFEIPIFVISAHNESSFFLKSINLNIDGYFIKPIASDELIHQIFKRIHRIYLQKQLNEKQINLEKKLMAQDREINLRDNLIQQQTKLASMGEMVDMIAHQWKQPLGIIDLKLALLIEEYEVFGEQISYEKVKECKSNITEQITHLCTTLEHFRDFFRPTPHLEVIEPKELLDSVLRLMKDELIKNNIFIEDSFQKDLKIKGNINEVKHIFINLFNNAKDAFIQNNIKQRKIKISSYKKANNTIISVLDNAGGIPSDIINNIFKANFTTKGEHGGTGIGLYMSEFIAKKNNALLEVENVQNGANFTLTFKNNF